MTIYVNLDLFNSLRQHPTLWKTYTNDGDSLHTDSRYDGVSRSEVMTPAVSEYLVKHGYKVGFPDDKKFAICLTHDIDDIYPPLSHRVLSGLYSLKKCDWSGLKKYWFRSRTKKETSPYMNFQKIMELEKRYGAKSTFYFMAASKDPRRFRYNPEDIGDEIRLIADSGWEVGLHGGFYSYNDIHAITEEKSRLEAVLGKEVIGYRNHYLRFQAPETWDILEKCGFRYDSTYGYTNMIGFRNGMCHPFRPYRPQSKKWMNIIELPLNVMECAMFEMVKPGHAWELIQPLLEQAETNRGVLTILWHNNSFGCPFREQWGTLYEKILQYGRERSAWMTSGEEIWKWWMENGY